MGFKFTLLCDLLSSLENNRFVKASTEATRNDPDARVVTRWFAQHGKRLRDKYTDQLAVLSCMFPEKRTDRVYGLQDRSLARVIGRCLLLGSSRREELEQWRQSGGADLGQCVENVMRQAENHIIRGQEITVEEIDEALNRIASRCRFSGPSLRRRQRGAVDVEEALSPLYRRLASRDAKWLTRMILKSFAPVVLPLPLTLRSLHFLLPHLLIFQDSFEAALSTLASQPMCNFPPHPDPELARSLRLIALQHLTPRMGVKIGRPEYYKARSIKNCCQMIGQRRISMERKYDGEYCQIHIDLSTHPSIQIFSKSGKDSKVDRSGIHDVLKEALRIGSPECKFSSRCILEGELLVWSDQHDKIMDFHKLRKFISRSGTFIGTENDSPPQPDEHLMIIFFDILLLDDSICLRKPHRERRLLLKEVTQIIHGRAGISDQRVLDFSHPGSRSTLESIFAKGVSNKWEGFVLKGCEDPYFNIMSSTNHAPSGRWIKLKKDYIPGLGDTVDLALIGGAYDSCEAAALNGANKLLWTRFFIGCLLNKDAVLQCNAVPKFRIVDTINRHCMSIQNMQLLNQLGEYSACSPESGHGFNIEFGHDTLPSMDSVFRKPFVVEMLGSGFEKPSGARYFALRFPRILKVHSDRTFEDAASFGELQVLAERARSLVLEDMAQDESEWSKRVKIGNGSAQYITNRSQSTSSS
ncbi:DNA ligase/mRNA capping enzyme, partial [Aspergillus campestris IBT 28561]